MMIQCPHCQTQYSLEEKQFAERSGLQIRCPKCQTTFPSRAVAGAGPKAAQHVPTQRYDEFNKRFQTLASPPSIELEATAMRAGGRPWLDKDKVVSLVVIDGPMKGKAFPVIKPYVLLGRREADIVLEDSDVSRKHCALEVHGASAVLVDLGSTNGTFVDDQRIETYQLEHMSEFRVGSTTMVFSLRKNE